MAQRLEHVPGEPAPVAATYEQLNIFGRPTGVRVDVAQGEPFPDAPRWHTWRLVKGDADEC
jgi:hypothetical protein